MLAPRLRGLRRGKRTSTGGESDKSALEVLAFVQSVMPTQAISLAALENQV
jgi:hypothetical protein